MKENKDAPYALAIEVLRRLDKAGVLQDLILVGSWCVYFYQDYFSMEGYLSSIRTRDMDFLISTPVRDKKSVNLPKLLEDLGFLTDFKSNGVVQLVHPELLVEFLVPDKGRGYEGAYELKSLHVNAQPLRYLNFLANHTIQLKSHGLTLKVPHPAAFALHKIIVSQRRRNPDKKDKDRQQAIQILEALIAAKKGTEIKGIFTSLPPGWRKKILVGLKDAEETGFQELLSA